MRDTYRTKGMKAKLLNGILSAGLVATTVLSPAVGEQIENLWANEEPAIEANDNGAEQGELMEGEAPAQGEAANDTSAEGDAPEAVDETVPSKGVAGEEASVASGQGETAATAAGRADGQHVYHIGYIERGWDGEKVTETHHDITSADVEEIPEDGVMDGGTYCPSRDVHFKKRMVVRGDSKLLLDGNVMVYADAGIHIEPGATLSVYSTDVFVNFGNVFSTLFVNAEHGAGIGAYEGHKGGDLVVHGGILEVQGGEHCAGIGSNDGDGSDVGTFTMYGGKVTATGGDKGAGIGGGRKSEAKVRIYGGEVHATGGEDGAGIGGGEDGRGGSIEIFGGDVTATGSTNASGIGGGENRDAGEVTISGGTVHAYHRDGAGIGGGEDGGGGGSVTITGGEVHSDYQGQGNGAGIGGGNHAGKGGTITISGGDVTVNNDHGAGIGGGRAAGSKDDKRHNSGDGGDITISGGTVHATSLHGHGIGAGGAQGYYCDGKKEEFSRNNPYSDIIGSAGTITIEGDANVTAKGYVAGVGGDTGTINMNGGKLTAEGIEDHDGGFGIRLISEDDAHLNVTGGTIHARGAKKQAAINVAHPSFTGGKTDARSKKKTITEAKELSVSGEGTKLSASSDDDISIDIKKIVVTEGATLESFSGGKSGKDAEYQFDDDAMVVAGANKDSALRLIAADRPKAYKDESYKYIRITPCDHKDFSYEMKEGSHHDKVCHYCGARTSEAHHLADNGACVDCGCDQAHPMVVDHRLLTDGTLGVEFQVAVPEGFDCSGATMEFQVSGKGGHKTEIPFADAQKLEGGRYGFVCPVSCIEMADEICVSVHSDHRTWKVEDYSVARYASDFHAAHSDAERSNLLLSLHVDLIDALADYGHYSQVLLARDNKWQLGTDHAEMPAAIEYTDTQAKEAKDEIDSMYDAISCTRGEGVNGVGVSIVQGSVLEPRVKVKTDRQVGSVTVDGEELPKGSWKRVGESWIVDMPAINAAQAGMAHTVVVTSVNGEELVTLSNLSPVSYVRSILDDARYDNDKDIRNAAAALYRYCKLSKCVNEMPQWDQADM